MEAKLSNLEMESLAKSVSALIYAKFISDGVHKELSETCEKYTKNLIDFYVSNNAITNDAAKVIGPVIEKVIRESTVIEDKLSEYMNTKEFQLKEIKELKNRIKEIEFSMDHPNE
jgi:hypothetical protein